MCSISMGEKSNILSLTSISYLPSTLFMLADCNDKELGMPKLTKVRHYLTLVYGFTQYFARNLRNCFFFGFCLK